MIQECKELEFLNLSNFDTSNVYDIRAMFHNCYKLEYLMLDNFIINDFCDFEYIFMNTLPNCEIIAKDEKLKNLIRMKYIF